MSEFHVSVVKIGKIGKPRGADTLSITQVNGAYPVVFKTGTFQPGDLAVHVPPDALVPVAHPAFAWLADKAKDGLFRVKYIKLRGAPSFGFLVPLSDIPNCPDLVEGQDVRELLGVTKYEPGPCYQIGTELAGNYVSLPQEGVVPLYDIEGLRKYENLFEPGEPVVVTEKIHGSNGRWVVLDGKLYCGSRSKFRTDSVWNRMAEKYNLTEVLGRNPGLVLYGEVYGEGIQDLTYGITSQQVAFFDIYDTRSGTWWDYDRFYNFCRDNDLPTAPCLDAMTFHLPALYLLAEGDSILQCLNQGGEGPCHVREGIVVRPQEERWDSKVGRVQLKLPGEGYLLRKQRAA